MFRCLFSVILKEYYCDGEDDCGDNSDEPEGCRGPMAPGSRSCGPGYLRCNNSRCIRSDLACNQKDDCGDNSDELPINTMCFGEFYPLSSISTKFKSNIIIIIL